ncbi:MAG: hypothetical protein ABSA16_01080 [Thermoguttaceae bacterium]|jgi:hypothetical protein
MNRTFTLLFVAVLAIVTAIVLPSAVEKAVGQDQSKPQSDLGQKTDQPSQPGMMQGDMKQGMMGGMEAMKMSEPMKMRCRMMMNMEVTSNDPAALLGLKDQLKLSDEQTKSLQAIIAQARQQAEKTLTDEQKAKLQPLEKLPKTMMEMHQQLMEKMGQAKGSMKGQMMCPMMQMMEK